MHLAIGVTWLVFISKNKLMLKNTHQGIMYREDSVTYKPVWCTGLVSRAS